MPEGGMPRDEAGVGRVRAPNPDELPGDAASEHPQPDDAGSANKTSGPGYVWGTPGAGGGRKHGERVCGRTPGRIASRVPTRPCGVATGGVALKT